MDQVSSIDSVTKITEQTVKDGRTTYTNIIKRFSQMNRSTKYGIIGYVSFAMITNSYSSYNAGVASLYDFRRSRGTDENDDAPKNAYEAVRKGCYHGSDIAGSIAWPLTIGSKVMPSIVMYMNPESND